MHIWSRLTDCLRGVDVKTGVGSVKISGVEV